MSQALKRPGWLVYKGHVMPIGDLRPHQPDQYCWCRPTNDDGVLVHHSMDKREDVEEGRARLA